MKGMKAPKVMTVEKHGVSSDRYAVSWEDGTHRYHVWLDSSGKPSRGAYTTEVFTTIYKNEIAASKTSNSTQHLRLESHPAIAEAIDELPVRAFEEADIRQLAREDARLEKERADSLERCKAHAAQLGYKLVSIGGE